MQIKLNQNNQSGVAVVNAQVPAGSQILTLAVPRESPNRKGDECAKQPRFNCCFDAEYFRNCKSVAYRHPQDVQSKWQDPPNRSASMLSEKAMLAPVSLLD